MTPPSPMRYGTVEIEPPLLRLGALARLRRDPTFFWQEPDRQRLIVGFGSSWLHSAGPGPAHITSCAAPAAAAFDRVDVTGDGPGPLVVGGFSFGTEASGSLEGPGPDWSEFPPGLLVLPEITIQSDGDRAWIGAVVPADAPAGSARSRADAIVRELSRQRVDDGPASRPSPAVAANGDEAFRALVKAAVAEVDSGKLAKVVAARAATVESIADPWRILDALRDRYPSCAVYGVFRERTVFVGASPELLVELQGGRVTANALAGTIDRGADDVEDARLEERLRHDPKELAEHQYVVQGLRRALHESGVALDPPSGVEIVKLANVQHLASPVAGRAAASTGVLDLVAAVHPTPAVAGMPRTAALDWLARHEDIDRGWYAGPIGWMNAANEGSFRVALRCALLGEGRARLFAGAGIVAGSRPDRELAETSAKLAAMLGALEGG